MTDLLLLRHGQSQAQSGEDPDQVNPALTALGVAQARCAAGVLAAFQPMLVVISPLRRAWQTYNECAVPGARVVFDSRIAEGNWGKPDFYAGILPLQTPEYGAPDTQHAWAEPPAQRVAALLHELLTSNVPRVAIVGHWWIFSELFRAFCGNGTAALPAVVASMDNCAVSRLHVDERGQRVITAWNDVRHLPHDGR